jgi:hypothetical protein
MEGRIWRARRPDGRRDWGVEMKIVVSILIFVEMSVSISCPLIRNPDASGFSVREKPASSLMQNRLRAMGVWKQGRK